MPDALLVLGATAAAAVVAAVVMLAGVWPARTGRSGLAALVDVLAVGGGIGVGCWWLGLLPKLPPVEDQDRLLLVLLPAVGVAEIAAAAWRRWPWFGRVIRVLLALPIPALLLFGSGWLPSTWVPGGDPNAPSSWTQPEALAILLGLGVLLAVTWGLLISAARRPGGFVVPAALGLITAAAGVSIILSGYASGGLIGLPFAGVAAGALVICWLLARTHAMTGVVGVGTVLLFGLLMAGRFFAELTTTNFALLIVAPLLCWLIVVPPVRGLKAPARFIVALIVCLLPAGAAVGLAYHSYPGESDESTAHSADASGGDAPTFDAPAFNAQPASSSQPSGSSSPSSAAPATAPRDPGADEPTSAGGPETKRSPTPTDPGEDSKK